MRVLIALTLSLLLAACGAMQPPARSSEGVAAAATAWVDAYNSRDPARIISQYEPDAILWGTSAKTVAASPEQVFDYFKGARARPDARVAITQQSIRMGGDMAVSSGSYTFSDARESRPARFTMVFRHRDGQWRLLHHHSSFVPN